MIIAVDGTAASGKGTLAKGLASALSLAYLDTGSLYRLVAFMLGDEGLSGEDVSSQAAEKAAKNLDLALLGDVRLRSAEIGGLASQVAAMKPVRTALLDYQRRFAKNPPSGLAGGYAGSILDGRDIGTVVVPEADIKFYVDADLSIRAKRRHKELINRGYEVMVSEVEADLKARDARDMSREDAPLKPARDAILFDTSTLGVDEMVSRALSYVREDEDKA